MPVDIEQQLEQIARDLIREFTDDELHDLEYAECAADFRYWLYNYGLIVDEGRGELYCGQALYEHLRSLDLLTDKHKLLVIWPAQEPFVDALIAGRNVISGKARQLGWSWLASNYEYWRLEFHDNERLLILHKTDDDAMIQLERTARVRRIQPPWIRRKPTVKGLENKHELALGTRECYSVLTACASTDASGRGVAARCVRCEEFAWWDNAEVVYNALSATAGDAGRQLIILSTAAGAEGNKYHDLWVDADAGLNSFVAIFMGVFDHPERNEEWYRAKCADIGEAAMKQEYPRNKDEMFIHSGQRYFSTAELKHMRENLQQAPLRTEYEHSVLIYKEPVDGHRYAFGGDPAEGGGDYSSGYMIDCETDEQVAELRCDSWRADEFADYIAPLCFRYNTAHVGIEINKGDATVSTLIRVHRYPLDRIFGTAGRPGFLTTETSRPLLLSDWRRALINEQHQMRSETAYIEHIGFGWYKKKWQHPPGRHDDTVFAGAIAHQVRKYVLSLSDEGLSLYLNGVQV